MKPIIQISMISLSNKLINKMPQLRLNFLLISIKLIITQEAAKLNITFIGIFINFSHFHGRSPSLYEDTVIFGATGFYLLINTIQLIGFAFIAWTIAIFFKHLSYVIEYYGTIYVVLLIMVVLVYLALYCYILSISLRWYTIISSV
jgi:hypothetical protein